MARQRAVAQSCLLGCPQRQGVSRRLSVEGLVGLAITILPGTELDFRSQSDRRSRDLAKDEGR